MKELDIHLYYNKLKQKSLRNYYAGFHSFHTEREIKYMNIVGENIAIRLDIKKGKIIEVQRK